MTFWIVAALLTVLATAVIAVPLLRAPKRTASALDFDRELYRARMREIATDLKLGRIDPLEADAAKAEEGRKLIALSASDSDAVPAGSRALARFTLFSAAAFIPLMAIVFYLAAGVPGMSDMEIASRPDRDLSKQSITQLLERAEAQLARNPNDVRGWRVVAPVYMRLGRLDDAVTAWRNALRLDPANVGLKDSLAEAITAAASGVVTEQARGLFDEVLKAKPKDAKARFYLAIALGQQGAHEEAAAAWRDLIADAPADAPWLPIARAQLKAMNDRLGVASSADTAQPGPTGKDVAAAGQMSPPARQSMIEGMVAELAAKLKENPQDKAGWQRLVRSYVVLGRAEDASKAVADAGKAFPDDAEFVAGLEAMAKAAPAGQGAQPGPTSEDVAAAGQMSPQDRQSMIEGMVAKLAAKLKENPQDKAGWQRLVRSYVVLGRAEDASKAVADAGKAFPDDAEFVAGLEAMLAATPAGGAAQ